MPKVGIFFVVNDEMLMDAIPVEQGEPYGDAVQHGGHYEFWERLVPKSINEKRFKSRAYDACPRGRVIYFPKKKEFRVYHDACLRLENEIMKVLEGFGLTGEKVELMKDEHYKCERCNLNFID